MDVIRSVIMYVRKRLCLIRVVSGGFWGVVWGMGVAALLLLGAFLTPIYWSEIASAAAVVFGGIAGLIYGFVKRPDVYRAAIRMDQAGYQERFLTAWENREKEDAFSNMQRRDTERFAKEIDAAALVPYRIAWKKAGMLGLGIVALVVLGMIPAPMKEQAEKRHEIAVEARSEIQKLEQTKAALNELQDLENKQTEALIRDLEQAKKELKAAKGKKEIDKARDRLAKKIQMAAKEQTKKTVQDSLLTLAEAYHSPEQKNELLAKEDSSKNKEISSQEQTGKDYADSENSNSTGAKSNSSDAKGDQNADKRGQNGENPSDGSSGGVGKSAGSDQNGTAKAEGGQSGKKDSKGSSQSGNQDGGGQGSNGGSENQSSNSGDSGNNPAGSGSQGNGSGSGSGSQKGNGSGSGGGGNGWNYGSKDQNEQEGSAGNKGQMVAIAAPTEDSKNLTGKKNEKGASEQIRSEEVQEWAGDPVAYEEVIADYTNQAYSDINQKQYPDELANVVKQYFEELNQ